MTTRWETPADWSWKSLDDPDVCEIVMGQSPPGNTYNETGDGLPFFQGKTDFGEIYPIARKWCTDPRKISLPGDVLISVRAPVGPTNLTSEKCIIGRGLAALRPTEHVNTKYLLYILRVLEETIAGKGKGSTFQNISKAALGEVEIPLPDLALQERIVARIEALLAEVREMQTLHSSIITDIGSLFDAVLKEKFDESETVHWSYEGDLGDLIDITAPLVNPTLPKYRNLPHIHAGVIQGGTGQLLDYNTAAEDDMQSGKYHFQPGVVLYSKIRPYLRKATIVDFEGVCSADMYPLVIKDSRLTPEFLMWALLTPEFTNYAVNLSGRARMPKLNRAQLFGYRLKYPTKTEQQMICHHLDQVRTETLEMAKLNEAHRQLVNQLEQAILTQAFRGEL